MKRKENYLLTGSLLGCALLLIARVLFWGNLEGKAQTISYGDTFPVYFLFLAWNTFLAAIPYVLSRQLSKLSSAKLIFPLAVLSLWLLFFPNAPYLVTDLIHLRARPPYPIWYDLLVLFAFACLGLLFGTYSMIHVQQYVAGLSPKIAGFIPFFIAPLAAIGVYLGRFLRWNSWEVFFDPLHLIADLWEHSQAPGFLQNLLIIVGPLSFIQWMFYYLILDQDEYPPVSKIQVEAGAST